MPDYLSKQLYKQISEELPNRFPDMGTRKSILNKAFYGDNILLNDIDFAGSAQSFSDMLISKLSSENLIELLEYLLKEKIGVENREVYKDIIQRIEHDTNLNLSNQELKRKLTDLLKTLDKDRLINVREFLNSCLPEDYEHEFVPNRFPNIESMVKELWNLIDEDGHIHGSLWRIVHNIAISNLANVIKQQFLEWFAEIRGNSDRVLPEKSPAVSDENTKSYSNVLLIEVNGQYTGKNKNTNNRYQVRAWIYQENQGKRPELIYSSNDNETIFFEQPYLETLFKEIIETESGLSFDRIEVFLPVEKLLFPVDQLTYLDDCDDLGKWVHTYPILVRSQERALGVWRKKDIVRKNWQGKWDHIGDETMNLLKLHNINIQTQTLKNLLNGNDKLACSCVIFPPTDPNKKKEILKRLIYNGVPAIFWFHDEIYKNSPPENILKCIRMELIRRGTPLSCGEEESFLAIEYPHQIISISLAIKKLPEIVSDVRKSNDARVIANREHIGNNWALLWDDPDLLRLPET